MRWSARTLILVGLGIGVAVSGTVVLRHSAPANTSVRAWPQVAAPTTPGTPRDITALAAEGHLQADKEQLARLAGELKSDLTALRAQLGRVTQEQEASGRKITHLVEKMSQAGSQTAPAPARDEKAAAATGSPEEERERAAARTQARIELLEGTMRTEKTDPGGPVQRAAGTA